MSDVNVIVDSREVEKALADLATLFSNEGLTAFMGTIVAPYLAKRAKERFASEGDDVVGKWFPLTPYTKNLRREQGFGEGPINRRTGELENWVTSGTFFPYPAGGGVTMRYPRDKPTGELRKKVQTAQGGKVKPRTPPRPVVGVNEIDLGFVTSALALAAQEAIR
jgi:hypothetical protein